MKSIHTCPNIDISQVRVSEFISFSSDLLIPPTGVLEHTEDPREFVHSNVFADIGKHLANPTKVHLCEFSSIPLHVDTVLKGMQYAHLVLHGIFTLYMGEEEYEGRPGQLFIMDPARPHTVVSKDRCVTLCFEM